MNNIMKKSFATFLAIAIIAGVAGCRQGGVISSEQESSFDSNTPITDPEVAQNYFKIGSELKRLPQTKIDIDKMVYDGFTGPLNREKWAVGNGFWGQDNGGVSHENVRYTDDGVLVLKAHGDHYMGDTRGVGQRTDGTRTGGAIISKFFCGPGHYEIKMKVTPRIGCCTAFWTFAYKEQEPGSTLRPFNSEIDIELPGGGDIGDVSLEKCCNTNWFTEDLNDTHQFAAKDFSDSIAHNDGNWHTYGFDWYSDPGIIVYHYDNKVTYTSIANLPTMEGRLNIGVWFPVGWTGIPNFDEDYMLVDSVTYEPFKDQPVEEFYADLGYGANTEHLYNDKPIVLKDVNKLSNGNFEFYKKLDKTLSPEAFRNVLSSKGWEFTKVLGKTPLPIEELSNIKEGAGIENSCAAYIQDKGIIRQTIDSCFKGYKYDFEFFAKAGNDSGTSKVKIICLDKTNQPLTTQEIEIKNTINYEKYTASIVCPENCRNIRIEGRTAKDNELFMDDVAAYFKGLN